MWKNESKMKANLYIYNEFTLYLSRSKDTSFIDMADGANEDVRTFDHSFSLKYIIISF